MKTVATENINPAKRTDHTYADFPGTMEESSIYHTQGVFCTRTEIKEMNGKRKNSTERCFSLDSPREIFNNNFSAGTLFRM